MENKFNSSDYWEQRYISGRNSGNGSYGRLATFKAEVINTFIEEHNVKSVLDFGCGDGNQASLFNCQKYIGFDTSKTAIRLCKKRFGSSFDSSIVKVFTNNLNDLEPVDLTLSCEVLFHLVEDDIFIQYLQALFSFSNRFVIIYSSNNDTPSVSCHMKHRCFTSVIAKYFPLWKLLKKVSNPYPEECFSDFYIYGKVD